MNSVNVVNVGEWVNILRYSMRARNVRLALYAALGALLVFLAVALAWWVPAARERAQLSQELAAKRAALAETARNDEVARAYRKALVAIALFEKKLDAPAGQADLIQGVAKLAAARGMHVVSQSFDAGHAQRGDAALYLELGLTGDYLALRRLLGDFATLPMWIEVVETRIEQGGDGAGQVRAQLRLLTYRTGQKALTDAGGSERANGGQP